MTLIPKKVIGIDLHDHLIQLVELKQTNGDIFLEAYNRLPIATGIIKEGIIEDEEAFKTVVTDLFRNAKPQAVEPKNIAILLPARTTFIHIFAFPSKLSEKEIKNAIPYEAEMVIPFPMQDLYWDFFILEKEEKGYQYILFAAVQKVVADKYTKVLGEIGITPELYGVHVEALKHALAGQIKDDEPTLIIEVGALSTNYLTTKGQTVKQYLSSNEGTSQLIQNIGEEFKISPDILFTEWENYKNDPKFQETIGQFIISKYKMASDIIMGKANDKNTDDIKNIFLTGEFSNLPGFYDLAKKQFPEINVMIGDPKKGLTIEDKKFARHTKQQKESVPYSIYFTNAIGVALSKLKLGIGDNGINLIPNWLKRNFLSKKIELIIVGGTILITFLSLITAGFMLIKHQHLSYERINLEIKRENVELTLYGTRYQEIKAELEAFNNEVAVLSNIDNGLFSVPTVFEELLDIIPATITITGFVFDDVSLSIQLSGIAENREDLLELQDSIKNSELIEDVEIPLSSYDKKENVSFEINLTLIFSNLPPYDTE